MERTIKNVATWAIDKFPVKLRRQFIGHCKAEGKSTRKVVEFLIRDYLHRQRKVIQHGPNQ